MTYNAYFNAYDLVFFFFSCIQSIVNVTVTPVFPFFPFCLFKPCTNVTLSYREKRCLEILAKSVPFYFNNGEVPF